MRSSVVIVRVEGPGLDSPEIMREVELACAETANEMGAVTAARAAGGTPIADEQRIRSLPQEEWWPKKVAKALKRRKSVAGASGHFYTRAEARRASQAMINRRLRRRGVARAGWRRPAEILSDGQVPGFGEVQNVKSAGEATKARPGQEAVCVIENHARGADKIGRRALDRAIEETNHDAEKIAVKHLNKRLKKYA